jgi:Ca2+-binding RTX toxin-like protein
MALTQFTNEQAILDLVASDFAYKPNDEIAVRVDKLQSFPDNAPEYEGGFPPSLVGFLDNALFARTHRSFIASGISVIEFDNWIVENKFNDRGDGFGAVVFKSRFADPVTNKFDYIVAFRGTDGLNAQDWYANLDLAKDVWARQSVPVLSYLLGTADGANIDQTTLSRIHFTGQSLGGGLAQYAAYTYAQQRKIIDGRINSAGISLITFNSFGGVRGLQQLNNGYDPTLLAGVETAHFVIDNDIVHRLGAGDPNQLASVGGSWHVNGKDNTYRFDFLQKQGGEFVRDSSGRILKLDAFAAHRIEPGFYTGFDNFQTTLFDFTRVDRVTIDYLDTSNSQSIGAAFSRIFNKGLTTEGSAAARLLVGLVSIGIASERGEIRRFSRALLDAHYASADVPSWKKALFETIAFPEVIRVAGSAVSPSALRALVLATGIEVLGGLSRDDKTLIWDSINSFLPSDQRLNRRDVAFADGIGEREKGLMHELALIALSSRLESKEIDEILTDHRQREAAKTLVGVGLDADALLTQFASGADWLRNSLSYLQQAAGDSGRNSETLVAFDVSLVDLMNAERIRLGAEDDVFQEKMAQALKDFLREDFGWALANARADFAKPFQLAHASVFGNTQFDFVNYDRIHDALVDASNDPRFASFRSLIEEALEPIELAGQRPITSSKGPSSNLFDTPGFDPDAMPLPSELVREGGVQRFTLSLPYGAAEGGQRIAITLDGTAAESTRLLAYGEEVLPQNGIYTVTVASGERELELSLLGTLGITQPGLTESGALSLSAALVDSAGQATHQTHVEANVDFAAREDLLPDEPFASALTAGNDTVLISTPLAGAHLDGLGGNDVMWGDTGSDRFLGGAGDDRLFGSFRLYFGANDRDWLSGGPGNDQLLGHEGDDLLEGDSGRDAVLGDVGNDILFAGGQADYATIFTLGGGDPSGDLVQGGAGDDLVVGSAGADALSGGNGIDLIFGGTGNDEIRGDTEFVPTHSFHIIGTTFPPEQPLVGGPDVLYGNEGNDSLLGEAGEDRLYGGEGLDRLIGGAGRDELYGGDGDDFLVGDADSLDPVEHADDYLHGGQGSDILLGHDGNDTLVGDGGDDFLEGGDGIDTYVFNRGDGADTIFDFGSNTVRFGPGIDASDLKLGLGSLFIHVGEDGDAIRIVNFDPDDVLGSFGVDLFEFLNGEQLTYAQLVSPGFDLEGTEESDFIKGTNLTDRITGGEGDDELDGRGGLDVLRGGRGDDIYYVDELNDVIEEAIDEGRDSVRSTAVSYVLSPNLETLELIEQRTGGNEESEDGGGGQVVITGGIAGTGNDLDNDIGGNSLNNVVDGGGGSDRLFGESGSDTYLFGRGSGADTIAEFVDAPGDVDAIQLGSDVVPADVAVLREENDLILAIRNSPDRVRIQDWFASDVAKIELALFEDGTAWDSAILEGMAATGGLNTAPVLVGGISDQIALEDAAFTFVIPADTFVDADSGDTLTFGATLEGGIPLASWLGFDPTTQTFSGTPTNDDVGIFDVTVTATDGGGLSAADVFRVTVENTNDPPVLAIEIANQSTFEDVPFSFTVPPDAFLDVDAGDVLTISAAFVGGEPLPPWLTFNPDTRTFSGIPSNADVGVLSLAVTATDGAGTAATAGFSLEVENVNDPPALPQPLPDQFGNQNAPFSLQIPEGAFLDVDAGDTLVFTATLGDGSPLPSWLEFDGATRVFSGTPSEFDIGSLGIRVTATDTAGASVSDDFALFISDASAVNETHAGTQHRDVIVTGFANDLIDADRGDDLVRAGAGRDTVFGDWGHDQLLGEAGNDLLDGGEGHDYLLGGPGEDLLAGGEGHDRLEGDIGDDVYVYERHGDHDVIEEEGGNDALLLSEGIEADHTRLSRRHHDLVVDFRGREGSVTVKGWFASDSKQVETIRFADGTIWDVQYIHSHAKRRSGYHDDNDGRHEDRDYDHSVVVRKDDERGRSDRRGSRNDGDRLSDLLEAYFARATRYDFEALAQELEQSDRRGGELSAMEIARRWERVRRFASDLTSEHDNDARHGAGATAHLVEGMFGAGGLGSGFGHAGSTGASRGAGSLQTLQGLEEGFRRLRLG